MKKVVILLCAVIVAAAIVIGVFVVQRNNLAADRDTLESENMEIADQLSDAKNEKNALSTELINAQATASALEGTLKERTDEKTTLEAQVADLTAQLADITKKTDDLAAQVESLTTEKDGWDSMRQTLEDAKTTLEGQLAAAADELEQVKTNAAAELETVQAQLSAQWQEKMDALQGEKNDLEQRLQGVVLALQGETATPVPEETTAPDKEATDSQEATSAPEGTTNPLLITGPGPVIPKDTSIPDKEATAAPEETLSALDNMGHGPVVDQSEETTDVFAAMSDDLYCHVGVWTTPAGYRAEDVLSAGHNFSGLYYSEDEGAFVHSVQVSLSPDRAAQTELAEAIASYTDKPLQAKLSEIQTYDTGKLNVSYIDCVSVKDADAGTYTRQIIACADIPITGMQCSVLFDFFSTPAQEADLPSFEEMWQEAQAVFDCLTLDK